MITVDRLKEVLNYDEVTGIFRWNVAKGACKEGSVAGNLDTSNGYWVICVDGVKHLAHRLAWLYVYEAWPTNLIDHKDTVKIHNWILNLREADHIRNAWNSQAKNKRDLPKGVQKRKNRFVAQIFVKGKSHWLGSYETELGAVTAYKEASLKHHGDFSIYK